MSRSRLISVVAVLVLFSLLALPHAESWGVWSLSANVQNVLADNSAQQADDHGDTIETATAVGSQSDTTGNLETDGDVDFFSFEALAGEAYVFETSLYTLHDSILELFDASGFELDSNDDAAPGVLASRIQHTATATETLFVEVSGYSTMHTGTYTLSIQVSIDDDGGTNPEAVELAVFTEVGNSVEFELSGLDGETCELFFDFDSSPNFGLLDVFPDSDRPCLTGFPHQDFYRIVYVPDTGFTGTDFFTYVVIDDDGNISLPATAGLTVVSSTDDHGNSTSAATPVVLSYTSGTATGYGLNIIGEVETGGDLDFFSFEGQAGTEYVFETSLGTLHDSILELFDASGFELDSNDDAEPGVLASRIEHTATATETLFVEVSGYSTTHTGTYTLSIHRAQAANVAVTPASGPTGTVATFTLTGAPPFTAGEINVGTGTSRFVTDASGSAVLTGLMDEPAGTRMDILITLTGVPQLISAFFTVTIPPSNSIAVPSTTRGNIDSFGSTNQFNYQATAGQTYVITTALDSLGDSTITLSDSSGERLAFNDDFSGLASRIRHTATASETLNVEVRGYASHTGTYTLSIQEEGSQFAFVRKVAAVDVTSAGATRLASVLGFDGAIIDLSEAIVIIDAADRYVLTISKKSGSIEFIDQRNYGVPQTAGLIERNNAIEIATEFLEATDLLPPLYEAESFIQMDRVNGFDVATSVWVAFTPLIQVVDGVVAPVRDGDIRLWIGVSGEILRLQSRYRKVEPELIPIPMLPEEEILRGLTLSGLPLDGLSRTLSFVAFASNYEQHFMDPLFEVIDDSGALIAATPATGFTPRLGYIGPDPTEPIVAGQTVLLQATATMGAEPYQFSWFSNLDGPLGSGDSLPTQLSPGMNRIDLTVTDQNGAGVSGSLLLNVVHNPALPTPQRVFLPWVDATTARSFLARQIPDNAAVESQPAPVRILPGGNIPDPIDATHIEVPSLTLGNIEFPGEVNRFAFETISGQTYVLETSLTTLADSVLTLFDTSGNQLERNDDYAYPELAEVDPKIRTGG